MLKDMQIFIPTRGRINKQTTLQNLPKEVLEYTIIVAPKDEVKALKLQHPHVVAQPSKVQNIAQKRAWIIKELADKSKLLMLDDDLKWGSRQKNGVFVKELIHDEEHKVRLLNATNKHVKDALKELEKFLSKYAHAGFGSRMGNSMVFEGYRNTTRMMHALAYDTASARAEIKFNRIDQKEDFDYTLQLLRKGFDNIVIHHTFVNPNSYGASGGCKEEREAVGHDDSADKLAALHPEFVKVVEKEYKTSIPRKEVMVQWKKAFLSSKKGK